MNFAKLEIIDLSLPKKYRRFLVIKEERIAMKKIAVGLIFALVGVVYLVGFGDVTAREISITEKFANTGVLAESGTYNFDKGHSSIGFEVKHMGLVNIPGYFKDFAGKVNYDADDISKSSVEFSAKVTSVDTRIERRDNHLRGPEFFDSEKHPEMTFKSTKVEKSGENLMVTGNFTLRGTTKSITIPVKVAGFAKGRRGMVMGAIAKTSIDRTDFGVNYGADGGMISKEVNVTLNIEARQAK